MRSQFHGFVRFATCGLALLIAAVALGQGNPLGKKEIFGDKSPFGGARSDDATIVASAKIVPADGDRPARLRVTAKIKSGWHSFSITQLGGGPARTEIKVATSPPFELGKFKAITPPVSHLSDVYENLSIEEHSGTVVWEAPLKLSPDVKDLRVDGAVFAQVCFGEAKCVPSTDYIFEATMGDVSNLPPAAWKKETRKKAPAGPAKAQSDVDSQRLGSVEFRRPGAHVTLRGTLQPPVVAPGGKARIVISATPETPFHVYALADDDADKVERGKPTLIALQPTPGLTFRKPEAGIPVISHPNPNAPLGVERYYSGAVDFAIEVDVAADAALGKHPVEGVISFQTSTLGKKDEAHIDQPAGARFQTVLEIVATDAVAANDPPQERLLFYGAAYDQSPDDLSVPEDASEPGDATGAAAAGTGKLKVILLNSTEEKSLPIVLLLSFVGGCLLNLMPCVLPVIGLKLLSFAGQAGHHRSRVLALNLWYTAGLLVVFAGLAGLAASFGLRWGEHFGSPAFGITVCCVVFAMALSFVGVWEIPLPGFVGSGKGTELAAQEGPAGAFFKGVMSTILATPCSGPFLGAVFFFTVDKPTPIIFLVYGFIGLGMASPYLLIGAFPALIRWLPKPGAWMDTFKQLMGFTLIGTTVYLVSTLKADYRMATLSLLLAVGVACWWIGRTPLYVAGRKQLRAWGQAVAAAAVIGYFGFDLLIDHPARLGWKKFTPAAPAELRASGKTVMVDFTANWCPTCRTNLAFAINTTEVENAVKKNGVVPLLADWTDRSTEIRDVLKGLSGGSIPVLAIYPAGRPDEVLVLRDIITQGQVLSALERAGPSDDAGAAEPEEERVSSVESGHGANAR